MLSGMREASKNWLGRVVLTIVMGLLIISFGLFGIGNWLSGLGQGSLAKVGSTEISFETFRVAFANQLQQLSNQQRRLITNEQARAAGIDQQVLGQLMSDAALDEQVKRLGLNVSEDAIAQSVVNNPSFKGINGQFDRAKLVELARQNGYTEAGFLAQQRQFTLRQQIVEGVAGGVGAPKILVDAMNRQFNEERSLDYVVISAASLAPIAAPDDAVLTKFFEERKADFRAPEYRKINYIIAKPEDFAGDVAITEGELKSAYDVLAATGKIGKPERRTIQQILYDTEAEAKAAVAKIRAGADFGTLIADKKVLPADVTLAAKTKAEMIDPVAANIAFGLAKGETSEPIAGSFGYTVTHVVEITPAELVPFEQVKASLVADVRARKIQGSTDARTKLDSLHDSVEDLRGSGKTLAEVAEALKLKVISVDSLDAAGRDKSGSPVLLPDTASTLKALFAAGIGADTEVIRIRSGGYIWYEIATIEPEHDRPLEEVKSKLGTAWLNDETNRQMANLAADQLKKLGEGTTLEQIAVANKAKVEIATALKRGSSSPDASRLGAGVVTQAFVTPIGGFGQSRAATGPDRIVFKVSDARVPAAANDAAAIQSMKQRLDEIYVTDIGTQYVVKSQSELGTTVNQRLLTNAVGAN